MKTTTTPRTPTGFGFDEIMRTAERSRFPEWYARTSRLDTGRQPTTPPHRG